MRPKYTRPLLAFFVLILASLACTAAYPAVMTIGQVECKDKHAGKWFDHYFTDDDFYSCSCPSSPLSNQPSLTWTLKDLQSATVEEMENLYCAEPAAASIATSTATPTPGPTATATTTPTKAPTATPLPYLSGEVRACNLTDRYINFTIDPNAIDPSGMDFEVTISGVPSTCSVPSSNTGILSCTFPQNQTFPARVIVNVDGFITNDFIFDGSSCAANVPPPSNNNVEEPAPIETPMD